MRNIVLILLLLIVEPIWAGTFGSDWADSTGPDGSLTIYDLIRGGTYAAPNTGTLDSGWAYIWNTTGDALYRMLIYDYDGNLVAASDTETITAIDGGHWFQFSDVDTLWCGREYIIGIWADSLTSDLCRVYTENQANSRAARWDKSQAWSMTPPDPLTSPTVSENVEPLVRVAYTELTDYGCVQFKGTAHLDDQYIYSGLPTTVYTNDSQAVSNFFSQYHRFWVRVNNDIDSAIGADQSITSTVSKFWVNVVSGSRTIEGRPLVTNTPVEDQSSWNVYSTGNNWGTAGGDYADTIIAQGDVSTVNRWLDFVFNDSGLGYWQDVYGGSRTHRGVLFSTTGGGTVEYYYGSGISTAADSARKAEVYIGYAPASEPSGIVDVIHSPDGSGVLHSPAGSSRLHGP